MTYKNVAVHLDNGSKVEITFSCEQTVLGNVFKLIECKYKGRDIVEVFEGDIPQGIFASMEHHHLILTARELYRGKTINSY